MSGRERRWQRRIETHCRLLKKRAFLKYTCSDAVVGFENPVPLVEVPSALKLKSMYHGGYVAFSGFLVSRCAWFRGSRIPKTLKAQAESWTCAESVLWDGDFSQLNSDPTTGDAARCETICDLWDIDVRDKSCCDYDKRTPLCARAPSSSSLGLRIAATFVFHFQQ